MSLQMKVFEENSSTSIHAVKLGREQAKSSETEKSTYQECWNCGYRHQHKKEACPALGKTCNKRNYFATECRSQRSVKAVAADEDRDEVFQTGPAGNLDDTQLITLKLESGNYLRFQVDTGAQCNVVPLGLYKKATQRPPPKERDADTAEDHSIWQHHDSSLWDHTSQSMATRLPLQVGLQAGQSGRHLAHTLEESLPQHEDSDLP